jgi:hypothetical protein
LSRLEKKERGAFHFARNSKGSEGVIHHVSKTARAFPVLSSMAEAAPAGVVLGIDVGVSKSVAAYGASGATSFGADLVRRACVPA